MSETIWSNFMESLSGEEKLLPAGIYPVEVTGARPFVRDGEAQRGIFLDMNVTMGPQKDSFVTAYISVPQPGDRRAGFWYAKKMAGFGDLTAVYDSMPDDLLGGLEVLCAAIIGKKVLAEISPGVGEYSNRNSLGATKPLDDNGSKKEKQEVSEPEAEAEIVPEITDGDPGF